MDVSSASNFDFKPCLHSPAKAFESERTFHCEKLKTRYNFYASFKVTLQGVEMEDVLSSHIWPSGILVNKLFYGRTLSHKKGRNN